MEELRIDLIDLMGSIKILENSILEESKKSGVLIPFINDIKKALTEENYPMILKSLDDLEEFMDLEFCPH